MSKNHADYFGTVSTNAKYNSINENNGCHNGVF